MFPAAQLVRRAAAALAAGTAARPFVGALTEWVQAQADSIRFVVLHCWAEVLERGFRPISPTPAA